MVATPVRVLFPVEIHRVDGRNLRALRELRGISLTKLANAVGISPPHLSYVEREIRDTSAPVAKRIADYLGVPLGAILKIREDTVA